MELGSTVLNYSITGCKQVFNPVYIPPISQGKDEAMARWEGQYRRVVLAT